MWVKKGQWQSGNPFSSFYWFKIKKQGDQGSSPCELVKVRLVGKHQLLVGGSLSIGFYQNVTALSGIVYGFRDMAPQMLHKRCKFCCCYYLVAKSCRTLCDPMDFSPPGSSVHGISQVRILASVAISFSRDPPNPGIQRASPALAGGLFIILPWQPPGKPEMQASQYKWRWPMNTAAAFCIEAVSTNMAWSPHVSSLGQSVK